ncbi:S41 family peptidase [Chitinophaga solisilvae]|uniref:S41 family peptidase n=1 Tax=Chitinophaga solisilvae TaxID=1233460 RepID=UPI00136D9DE7|nr:S41 family peptidase [Chitinophaga solisilvae]
MRNYVRILLAAIGSCTLAFTSQAQSPAFSKSAVEAAVKETAVLIRKHYVFADQGEKIAAHLLEKYKAGAFDKATAWQGFDTVATRILRSFSHDGHLYIRCSPEKVRNIRAMEESMKKQQSLPPGVDEFFYGQEAAAINYGFAEVSVLPGNIGYIRLSQVCISGASLPVLYAAMEFVGRTKALVLDFRNNGGGGSDTGAVIESYFLPPHMPLLNFYSRTGKVTTDSTVSWLKQGPYKQPLYILVNKGTASAAEAIPFVLQAHNRAIVAGQPSAGGANHNVLRPLNDALYISISEEAPQLPGTARSWEHTGVQPDIVTAPGEELSTVLQRLRGK